MRGWQPSVALARSRSDEYGGVRVLGWWTETQKHHVCRGLFPPSPTAHRLIHPSLVPLLSHHPIPYRPRRTAPYAECVFVSSATRKRPAAAPIATRHSDRQDEIGIPLPRLTCHTHVRRKCFPPASTPPTPDCFAFPPPLRRARC